MAVRKLRWGYAGLAGDTKPAYAEEGAFFVELNSSPPAIFVMKAGTWTTTAAAAGAPSTADYLVGTTDAGLSAEIVVGTAPGGELGGTWASPTVDTTHSGSAHHAAESGTSTTHKHAVATIGGKFSLSVENPTATEDISIGFTNAAITITEIRAVLVGSATPSVTWTVRHGTDRSAAGAEAVTSGTATTSTTTGSDVVTFNDATIVADSFIWLETTAKSGTVTEIHLTIIFTVD